MRDFMTNSKLFKMKLSNTTMCYLCGEEIETITYLFWKCKINYRLWERLKTMLTKSFGYMLYLNPEVCILETMEGENHMPARIRLMIISTKQYIHDSKCNSSLTSFKGLLARLKGLILLDLMVLKSRNLTGIQENYYDWEKVLKYIESGE